MEEKGNMYRAKIGQEKWSVKYVCTVHTIDVRTISLEG